MNTAISFNFIYEDIYSDIMEVSCITMNYIPRL